MILNAKLSVLLNLQKADVETDIGLKRIFFLLNALLKEILPGVETERGSSIAPF